MMRSLSFLSLFFFFLAVVFSSCPLTSGATTNNTTPTTSDSINNCYNQNTGVELAKCVFGYGGGMKDFPVTGGKTPYQVTSNADSGPGTLRDAISQSGRFITFSKSMTIVLTSASLRPPSNTTIDGRGQSIVITGKSLRINKVSNIIVSNIAFINLNNYDCKCSNCDVPKDIEYDDECADAVNVQASSQLWFVHCTFTNSHDGLLDMKDATHHVTVSHCKFYTHDKVMLIGSSDSSTQDKAVRLTVAYNYFFGTGQRTPRIRFGVAHVYNNVYESWTGSALGASSSPTIISEGNFFIAGTQKEVADFKSVGIYVSRNDRLLNGAKAIPTSGLQNTTITDYQYNILDTDDQRREAIVRDAGNNVPTGVPTSTTPPVTTSTPPATTPAATTPAATTPAATTPAATTPAATTPAATTPSATTPTPTPTPPPAATTPAATTPAATTPASTTPAATTPASNSTTTTTTTTTTIPTSTTSPVPGQGTGTGTGTGLGISLAHPITPISCINLILVISLMFLA